jgi:hypothetical protein
VAQLVRQIDPQDEYGATLERECDPAVVIGEVPGIVRLNVPDHPLRQRHGAPAGPAEEASF